MIQSLVIKNFAIIEDIEINFKDGMNILLGETGAGKSIIIDALGLLMGNRSDFDKIRNGQTKAFVEGAFYLENKQTINKINAISQLIENDNLLLVSRTLENGKSICKINYHQVPQSILKTIMEDIIDIHSQHKDNSFFDEKIQIDYVDLFLKSDSSLSKHQFAKLLLEYQEIYGKYRSEERKYQEMIDKKSSFDDVDYLNFQIQEIEKVNLKKNEIEEIEDQLSRLSSFQKVVSSFQNFKEYYKNASENLYLAKKELSSIHDDQFEKEIERFETLYYDIDDCYESLNNQFSSLLDAQNKIEYLNNRKLELAPLRRKYGRSTKEIFEYLENVKNTVDLIINYDDNLLKQENIVKNLHLECEKKAEILSKIRFEAKDLLERNMNSQLDSLGLVNAKFLVNIEKGNLNKKGNDQICFLLRANVGSKYLSLSQTASLGETSRINLAYKLVFNKLNPVGTIIFDEIDTGISSHIGVLVAKKIKELSKRSQVIVITHLPQMAAIGDVTYFVSKKVIDNSTKTFINELSSKQVVEEIAKMISGEVIDQTSLLAAESLIKSMNS